MSLHSPKTLAVLLVPELPVALQMRWAARLAAARKLDLLVLHRVEARDDHTAKVSLDERPAGEATGVIHEVQPTILS